MRESRVIALCAALCIPAVVWTHSAAVVAALAVVVAGYCFAREQEARDDRSKRIHESALSELSDLRKLTQEAMDKVGKLDTRVVTVENRTRKPGER